MKPKSKTGKAPKQCGVTTKAGGKCKHAAGLRTNHPGFGPCWMHLGNTKMVEQGAASESAQAELRAKGFGQALDLDPHEALLMCIRVTAGEVQYATFKVEEIEASDVLVQSREEHDRPLSMGKDGEDPQFLVTEVKRKGMELNAWIKVRHDGMDRLVRYSAAALRAGLEERLVQVAEVQGKLLAGAVEGILRELGVADRPETPAVVRRHLTQLTQRTGETV